MLLKTAATFLQNRYFSLCIWLRSCVIWRRKSA